MQPGEYRNLEIGGPVAFVEHVTNQPYCAETAVPRQPSLCTECTAYDDRPLKKSDDMQLVRGEPIFKPDQCQRRPGSLDFLLSRCAGRCRHYRRQCVRCLGWARGLNQGASQSESATFAPRSINASVLIRRWSSTTADNGPSRSLKAVSPYTIFWRDRAAPHDDAPFEGP